MDGIRGRGDFQENVCDDKVLWVLESMQQGFDEMYHNAAAFIAELYADVWYLTSEEFICLLECCEGFGC